MRSSASPSGRPAVPGRASASALVASVIKPASVDAYVSCTTGPSRAMIARFTSGAHGAPVDATNRSDETS